MNFKYKVAKKVRDYCDKVMRENYLKPYGGSNSCCPNCKKWESEGNTIYTTPSETDEQLDTRRCVNCGYTWDALFTPAGFIPVKDLKRI